LVLLVAAKGAKGLKIALITLSGDTGIAHSELQEYYGSNAEIIDLPRQLLEEGSMFTRLRKLRREKADVFAIMTESLPWQYGQEALMYFGALAGTKRSVILDGRRDSLVAGRASLLSSAPIRIANSFLRGRAAVRAAETRMTDLESSETAIPIGSPPTEEIKVAYFRTTPSAGTVPGGATSHINGVTKGLQLLGASVEFISNDPIAGVDPSLPNFHVLGPEPNVMPRAAFDIANGLSFADRSSKLVSEIRPSFIYERYSRFSVAGVTAAMNNGVPLLLEYNGSEVWVGKHWDSTAKLDLLERYELANLGFATRIFVISEVEKNNLLERGVPEGNIVVNPNGVDTDKFRAGVGGLEERRRIGVADEDILVGFLGTFGPWHGVLTLAEAIALTPKSSGIKFLFVGDGSLRAQVEKRIASSNDLDRVIFTGSVHHDRVPALLDACDILVSPHVPLADGTAFFGSPTKLFEYMAMGKGIVASRLGQIGDVLENDVNALLVEPGNADQLSKAIQKLSNDRPLLERLGRSSRQAAIERHTWKQNAERVLDTYRNLKQ
jgi:glycosyltransferase involved in cell wall biosynthesis